MFWTIINLLNYMFCSRLWLSSDWQIAQSVPKWSTFDTAADSRLQKPSASCKVFLNHYNEHTVYICNTYTPDKEFPMVTPPGLDDCLVEEVRESQRAAREERSNNGSGRWSFSSPPFFFTPYTFSPSPKKNPSQHMYRPPSLSLAAL